MTTAEMRQSAGDPDEDCRVTGSLTIVFEDPAVLDRYLAAQDAFRAVVRDFAAGIAEAVRGAEGGAIGSDVIFAGRDRLTLTNGWGDFFSGTSACGPPMRAAARDEIRGLLAGLVEADRKAARSSRGVAEARRRAILGKKKGRY